MSTSSSLPTYELPDAKPTSCLFSPEQDALVRAQGAPVRLTVAGKPFLLPQTFLDRADSVSFDRLYQAGIDLVAWTGASALSTRSYDKGWEASFKHNLELLDAAHRERQKRENQASVSRRMEIALGDEAQELVGRVLARTQAGGLRSFFDTTSSDRSTVTGKLDALHEIADKAEVPTIRQALLGAGVEAGDLTRIVALTAEIKKGRFEQAQKDAEDSRFAGRLRVLKAMVLAEISKVSAVAKAHLPEGDWAALQVGRLLDQPARGRVEPPAPQPPAPTPAPGPVAFATPATGTTPAAFGATTGATTPATFGATTGATAPATLGGALPVAPPTLVPGTILSVVVPGGPTLPAQVQPDGTLAFLPTGTGRAAISAPAAASAPRRKGRAAPRRRPR